MYSFTPPKETISSKVVILGQSAVGKSSIINRFIHDKFDDFQESTIGAAFFTKTIEKEKFNIKLDIWDTAGQERYRSLAPMYYRGAKVAIVVFDLTDSGTLSTAKIWINELRKNGDPRCEVLLVGNKSDLYKQITNVDINNFAIENDVEYIEASAKTGSNIKIIFDKISDKVISNQSNQVDTIKISNKTKKEVKKCC